MVKKKNKIILKETILQEAQKIVYGDRQTDYGSVTENFENIARMWQVILKCTINPEQVGLCMIAMKITRQLNKSKRDNLVDIAGYAATIEKMEIEERINEKGSI